MKITSVHDAIENALLEFPDKAEPAQVYSFRCDPEVMRGVQIILGKRGITVSSFVRNCCEGLVNDFTKEPPLEDHEIAE